MQEKFTNRIGAGDSSVEDSCSKLVRKARETEQNVEFKRGGAVRKETLRSINGHGTRVAGLVRVFRTIRV